MTVPDPSNQMLDAALAFHAAGCSVVPAMPNGSKRPLGTWLRYQNERPTTDQIHTWYDTAHPGIGLVCGEVSGGLIMLEAEGRAVGENLLARARENAMAAGIGELWRTVTAGYFEHTPGGGVHILYRISDGATPGNQKLARRPGTPDAAGNPTIDVLAETRGEGGFTIVAPSHGPVHPSGRPWTLLNGGPATIPTITLADHTALCSVFRSLDEMPTEEDKWRTRTAAPATESGSSGSATSGSVVAASPATPATGPAPDLRPGDDYILRGPPWTDILEPHGWRKVGQRGAITDWLRPGKDDISSPSATTSFGGDRGDFLFVFSTSTTFKTEVPYNKFQAYTHLNHNDDASAAARELRRQGYGGAGTPSTGSVFDLLPPQTPAARGLPAPNPTDAAADPAPPATGPNTEELLAARRAQLEELAYEDLRARDVARKRYDAEILARDFRPPVLRTLREELALPDEPVQYRVDKIFPEEANVLITASYKVGKTTLIGNLARALVDGGNFLDKFAVQPMVDDERVTIFNYELSEKQYRVWLRDIDVTNVDAVSVCNLRGINLPLAQPWAEDFVVKMLVEAKTKVWVADPFARAFVGSGEENSNTDVGAFVHILDRIKLRAGVSELVMPTHTGRGESSADRTRGAVRLNDWADVQWLMLKDEEGIRYFSADGRDVEIDEEKLTFDEATRSLRMGGGDRKWQARIALINRVVEVITENPGVKASELVALVGGRKQYVEQARDAALHEHRIRVEMDGPAKLYYPTSSAFGGLR